MTPIPIVSIIIPTYNMRRWIGEAIDSALAQTYPACEVIVVDDGSTDGTADFLRERYGDRIRLHVQPNAGRAAARNKGFALSQGDYIQFFDADDLMEPDALRLRVDYLQQHPEVAVAYGRPLVFWEDDPAHPFPSDKERYFDQGIDLKTELHAPLLWTLMALVRRKWVARVSGMDEDLTSNEDWHFWLKIAAAGGQFAFVDGPPVARYRQRRANSPDAALAHQWSGIQTLEKIKSLVRDRADYPDLAVDRAIGRQQYGYGYWQLKAGSRKEGLRWLLTSLRHNRESLPAKLVQIGLALVFPPHKVESTYLRLRSKSIDPK